jgi:LysM repeat protein
VVTLSATRSSEVQVAGVSAPPAVQVAALSGPAARLDPPVFTSSLRSWAAASPAPNAPAKDAPDAQPAAQPATTYIVAPGDTLSQIAQRYGVDVDTLARANQLTDRNRLLPGVRLTIPQPAALAAAATSLGAGTPEDAVRAFYAYLDQGRFDEAAALWSDHMRTAYPPAENIYGRFAATQSLTVNRADVVQLDAANGRATVAVSVAEVLRPTMAERDYTGTWYLVRGPAGWLLDQPSLEAS